ncbi:hypothetical protein BJX61DRAFT_484429 [Aspergillus egyptiacus]|nr:hypothetical protein BJX61DRAFT_484429 [Aspergillus egyptiacus]
MPSYRVELASTSRAGCQNKECKDQKIKIQKGELRHGSWVDTENFQSFFWRHWGCVTPKIISNMKEIVEDGEERDLNRLDGFEELEPEAQEKVARALAQGHVDDEDWKGDPEMNQPGKSGYRVRATPKKTKKGGDKNEEEEEEGKKPAKASKASKSKKAGPSENGEDEETKPRRPKRTATGRPKKEDLPTSDEEEDGGEDESPVPKAKATKRGRRPRGTGTSKRKRAKGDDEEAAEDEAEPVAEKPKRGRKKKAT